MSSWSFNARLRRLHGIISTDDIIPGRYKHMFTDPGTLAPHVFENCLPGFAGTLRDGDALISSELFGIGSSREQAVTALLSAGVRIVIAPSFGRIFFRNAWNLGLPLVEASDCDGLDDESEISVDLVRGELAGSGRCIRFSPPPSFMLGMLSQGGLLALVKERGRIAQPNRTSEQLS